MNITTRRAEFVGQWVEVTVEVDNTTVTFFLDSPEEQQRVAEMLREAADEIDPQEAK